MFRLMFVAVMVTMVNCDKVDCGSKKAWAGFEDYMAAFLAANDATLATCYNVSGCPNPLTNDLKGHRMFNGGCGKFAKAGSESLLDCPKFYDCINKTGQQLTQDSESCIRNAAPHNQKFKFPTVSLYHVMYGLGKFDVSGTCSVPMLVDCINLVGLQVFFCNATQTAISTYFTGCTTDDMMALSNTLSSCLGQIRNQNTLAYTLQFQMCMADQFALIDQTALDNAFNSGLAAINNNIPTHFCT